MLDNFLQMIANILTVTAMRKNSDLERRPVSKTIKVLGCIFMVMVVVYVLLIDAQY